MLILPENPVIERIYPAEKYRGILDVVPLSCVDVVAYRGDNPRKREVLMVQRLEEPAKDFYWFPGGRLFKNEGLVECARRKLKQECGIERADILRQIGTFPLSSTITSIDGVQNGYHALGIDYLAHVKEDDPVVSLDATSKGYRWLGYDAINDLYPQGLHPYQFEVLNAANVFDRKFDKYDASHGHPSE